MRKLKLVKIKICKEFSLIKKEKLNQKKLKTQDHQKTNSKKI